MDLRDRYGKSKRGWFCSGGRGVAASTSTRDGVTLGEMGAREPEAKVVGTEPVVFARERRQARMIRS